MPDPIAEADPLRSALPSTTSGDGAEATLTPTDINPADPRHRARLHRAERLREIQTLHGGIDALATAHRPVAEVLRTQGWDDEFIALWLTHAHTYLDGQTPAAVWATGDPVDRDTVIYAAHQRAHV